MADYQQGPRLLEVSTPLGTDVLLLTGFSGQEGISQLFRFELELLAENKQKIAFDKLLGRGVGIRVGLGGGKDRYFAGICSRLSQGARDQDFTRYRMEMVPGVWLLTKRFQSRIFQQMSVPDILAKVFQGIDVSYQIQGKFEPRDYCAQYRETDFDFASRLMEEEGIFYFFKHTSGGHSMVVANAPASHPDLPEQSQIIYEGMEGGTRDEDRIHKWEKVQEISSGKYTVWDYSFELPGKRLEADKTILESVQVGKVSHKLKVQNSDALEVFEYPGGYAQRFAGIDKGGGEKPADLQKVFEDNKRTVAIRMQQEALGGLVIQGASNVRAMTSGHRFNLTKHFDADGQYVLTTVRHSATLSGDFRTGQQLGLEYENQFNCIPLALPFRPKCTTPEPKVEGTQTAVVVGPPGETVFCDKYGRVKVQFHWDRQGKFDADSSCWVRVSTIWAGNRRGVIHVPMVGDEVIVDFLEGDPDRPIIIGSVYNADMMPPDQLPAGKETSGFKGRTGSNFQKSIDTKGKELYKINAEKDFHLISTETIYMQAGTYYKVVAPKIFLEATEIIHLTVGGNEIKIEKSGIQINGATITSVAKGPHEIKGAIIKLNC